MTDKRIEGQVIGRPVLKSPNFEQTEFHPEAQIKMVQPMSHRLFTIYLFSCDSLSQVGEQCVAELWDAYLKLF